MCHILISHLNVKLLNLFQLSGLCQIVTNHHKFIFDENISKLISLFTIINAISLFQFSLLKTNNVHKSLI